MAEEEVQTEVVNEVQSAEETPKSAFVIWITEDNVSVRPLPADSGIAGPRTMDDVYNACSTICRNINNQQIGQEVAKTMMQAAMAAQSQHEQSQSKLVVPAGVDASKLKG